MPKYLATRNGEKHICGASRINVTVKMVEHLTKNRDSTRQKYLITSKNPALERQIK